MTRLFQIASVIAAAGAAVFVFQVKYRAEAVAEHARKLQRHFDQESEILSLLRAEWSVLIQPARVQDLVERHADRLKLQPLDPVQITRLENLPARPKGPAPEDASALSAILQGPQGRIPLGPEQALTNRERLTLQPQDEAEADETVDMGEER